MTQRLNRALLLDNFSAALKFAAERGVNLFREEEWIYIVL